MEEKYRRTVGQTVLKAYLGIGRKQKSRHKHTATDMEMVL